MAAPYLVRSGMGGLPHQEIVLPFFFDNTATPEIYTLSLHDALPISPDSSRASESFTIRMSMWRSSSSSRSRSEEHTSELQSLAYLVCRLLLEKKKKSIHENIAQTHYQL